MKKRNSLFLGLGALAALSLGSCSADEVMSEGEGMLALSTSFDSTVRTESRAVSDDEEAHLNETLQLWIYKQTGDPTTSGVIRQYKGIDQVPQTLALNSGTYSVEAWAGDSVSASWDKRWYHGIVDNVTINKGESTQTNVMCKIANVAVEVKYDDEVTKMLEIDSLVVSHSRAWLTFKSTKPEHTLGYFMMPNGETTLSWTISGHRKTGDQVETTLYTVTRNITNVVKGRKYVFDIKLADGESDVIGGGFLDIAVNEEPLATDEEQVEVKLAPAIAYQGTDNLDPVRSAPGQVGEKVITINASGELTSVILKCEQLSSILSGPDVNLISNEVTPQLENYIVASYAVKDDKSSSSMYISLRDDFTKLFNTDGVTYEVKIKAVDSFEKTTEKTAQFIITDSPIAITPINPTDAAPNELTATKMVVSGEILDMDKMPANPQITMYYTEGVQSSRATWQSVPATITGNTYSATLTGLTPGTTYSYYAAIEKSDGSTAYTEIAQAATEPALQLPNSSFEDWQDSSAPYLIYKEGDEMFWDSGNKGSSTLKKNVTIPDTSIKHSGNRSIQLASQFVSLMGVGKFAAGNVFAGKYIKTLGTNGVLGWGRPFTGRPTKLKGWVKYSPVAIDYLGDGAPTEYVKGNMDKGILYVALMDDHTESYEGESYPVIIKTGTSPELFTDEKYQEHKIAYGEIVWSEATAGDGMIEFEVPLEYYRTDIRPTYIIVTAAASKGGDYFTGGTGSTLWLDDLELVYE